jgi:hypothetical protein
MDELIPNFAKSPQTQLYYPPRAPLYKTLVLIVISFGTLGQKFNNWKTWRFLLADGG